jgi:uncharacterized protein YjiS (DUF1127 family)
LLKRRETIMLDLARSAYWPSQYQLHLWARRQRSLAAAGWMRGVASAIVASSGATVALIAASLRRAEGRRRLLALEDRMLADIGLTRGEIESAVNGTLRRLR